MKCNGVFSLKVVTLLVLVWFAMAASGCSRKPEVNESFSFRSYGDWHTVWQVLDREDNRALIITKYAIDIRDFNEGGGKTTWADCSLRIWLNDSYYNTSFAESERRAIQKTTLGDTGTEDYIFLLSSAEVEQYFPSTEDLLVSLLTTAETERSYAQRVGDDDAYEYNYNSALKLIQDLDDGDWPMIWWLRSPAEKGNQASMVTPYGGGTIGSTTVYGFPPFAPVNGVRPAMWVDLESIDLPGIFR